MGERETAWTPGPWKPSELAMNRKAWAELADGMGEFQVVVRGPDVIAAVWCGEDRDGEEAANARLIAAAPDLYHTLAWVRKNYAAAPTALINEQIDAALSRATQGD